MTPSIISAEYDDRAGIKWCIQFGLDQATMTDAEMSEFIVANKGRPYGEGGQQAEEFEREVMKRRFEILSGGLEECLYSGDGPFTKEKAATERFIDEKGRNPVPTKMVADYVLEFVPMITFMDTGKVLFYANGVYHEGAEAPIAWATERLLGGFASSHVVNEVIGHISRSTYKKRETLEDYTEWVCLQNGLLNIKTKEFVAHSPERFFTTQLPLVYDPAAKCPLIDQFVGEIVGAEDVALIFEFLAYCLEPGYRHQKALLAIGGGRNGKSTYLDLLRAFLGPKNVSSVTLQQLDEDRFAIANLYGKRANVCADISAREMKDTGSFKGLTGGDALTAQFKNQGHFSFKNSAKLVFSCNTVPRTDDNSVAFYRRWILVNFPNEFIAGENADPAILEKLTTPAELSGLLNKALGRLAGLNARGTFSNAASVEATQEKYMALSDSIYCFVNDKCVIDNGEITEEDGIISGRAAPRTLKADIDTAYKAFCKERKLSPVSDKRFKTNLLRVAPSISDGRVSRTDRRAVWVGIRLKNETEKKEDAVQTTFAIVKPQGGDQK